MAQTTGAISFKDCKIEISTNGTAWTDIGGFANEVQLSGGDRAIVETPTFTGGTMILTAGKLAALTITIPCIYTEGVAEPFEVYRAAYEAGTPFYARWSPAGGASGDFQYASAAGIPKAAPYPAGTAKDGNPAMFNIVITTPSATKSAVV